MHLFVFHPVGNLGFFLNQPRHQFHGQFGEIIFTMPARALQKWITNTWLPHKNMLAKMQDHACSLRNPLCAILEKTFQLKTQIELQTARK